MRRLRLAKHPAIAFVVIHSIVLKAADVACVKHDRVNPTQKEYIRNEKGKLAEILETVSCSFSIHLLLQNSMGLSSI
jgi:hypothetical protein